jgi:hypothetical protein
VRTLAELGDLPPPRWIVHELVPEGVAVLFGDANTGKSTLAVDWSLRVHHGLDWHGRAVRGGSVLYVAGEGVAGIAARARAWRQMHLIASTPHERYMAVATDAPALSSPAGCAELSAVVDDLVARHGHAPALIVVDTVSAHWAESEDKTEFVAPALRRLAQLAATHKCGILLLHHPRKPGDAMRGAADLTMLRGSSAWGGNVDAALFLVGKPHALELRAVKLRDAERGAPIHLALQRVDLGVDSAARPISSVVVLPGVPVTSHDPIPAAQDADEGRRIREALANLGTAGRVDTVVRAARMKLTMGRAAFDRELSAGRIVNGGSAKRPKYRPVVGGTAVEGGGASSPHTPKSGTPDADGYGGSGPGLFPTSGTPSDAVGTLDADHGLPAQPGKRRLACGR